MAIKVIGYDAKKSEFDTSADGTFFYNIKQNAISEIVLERLNLPYTDFQYGFADGVSPK